MNQTDQITQDSKASEDWFAKAYSKHKMTMVAYATAIFAGDTGAAEDAVDDAFADLWKTRNLIKKLQSERAWIRRLVRNKAIDRLRKDGRFQLCDDDGFFSSFPCEDPNPEQNALSRDAGHLLQNALGSLNVDQREAIVLCYYEGLSLPDIAMQTGSTLGTVKTRLFYARRKLKASITALSDSPALAKTARS